MDKFIELAVSRIWIGNERIVGGMFRVFCALVVAGHDSNALFMSVPDLMTAFMGDPVTLLGAVAVNYATLQLLIDTGVYLDNDWTFNFVRDQWDRLNAERAPGARDFQGSDEFWRRVFHVSIKNSLISIKIYYTR